MAIGKTDIRNVGVTQQNPATEPRTPAANPQQRPQAPVRDVRADASRLNQIATPSQAFRSGSILTRNVAASNAAERGLPGGSVNAAWGRAEEFGDVADVAAARVAANHPDIFGA